MQEEMSPEGSHGGNIAGSQAARTAEVKGTKRQSAGQSHDPFPEPSNTKPVAKTTGDWLVNQRQIAG